jgi:hypothetical protein
VSRVPLAPAPVTGITGEPAAVAGRTVRIRVPAAAVVAVAVAYVSCWHAYAVIRATARPIPGTGSPGRREVIRVVPRHRRVKTPLGMTGCNRSCSP